MGNADQTSSCAQESLSEMGSEAEITKEDTEALI